VLESFSTHAVHLFRLFPGAPAAKWTETAAHITRIRQDAIFFKAPTPEKILKAIKTNSGRMKLPVIFFRAYVSQLSVDKFQIFGVFAGNFRCLAGVRKFPINIQRLHEKAKRKNTI
jgi:hypothetical protein